jgi:hypothetical protein
VNRRQELRESLQDELATIHALNQTLRQPNVHDGQRAEAQKARGIAIAEVSRLLRLMRVGDTNRGVHGDRVPKSKKETTR